MKVVFRVFLAVTVIPMGHSTGLGTTVPGDPLQRARRLTPGAATWTTTTPEWAGTATTRTMVSVFGA
jgi:hypothetical protein